MGNNPVLCLNGAFRAGACGRPARATRTRNASLAKDGTARPACERTSTGSKVRVIYKKWFEAPVPPSGLNFRTPMTAVLRNAFAHPSDSPDPASYEH